jgi:hypothetical protein
MSAACVAVLEATTGKRYELECEASTRSVPLPLGVVRCIASVAFWGLSLTLCTLSVLKCYIDGESAAGLDGNRPAGAGETRQ